MPPPDLRTAASLLERGDYDAARVSLEWLVNHDRAYASAHVLLAKIAEHQSRFSDALLDWERAYLINPLSTEIAVSYETAILRDLLPNPDAAPVRKMHLVPPLEDISDESTDSVAAADPEERVAEARPQADSEAQGRGKKVPVDSPGREPIGEAAGLDDLDDLDKLIDELDSARIIPDPDIEAMSAAELKVDIDDVVSETLAKIYASQSYFSEAGDVYEKLAEQQPKRRAEFEEKATDMHTKAAVRS